MLEYTFNYIDHFITLQLVFENIVTKVMCHHCFWISFGTLILDNPFYNPCDTIRKKTRHFFTSHFMFSKIYF